MTTPLVETVTTKRVVAGEHRLSNRAVLYVTDVGGKTILLKFSRHNGGVWGMDKTAIAELIGVLQEIHDAMPEVK